MSNNTALTESQLYRGVSYSVDDIPALALYLRDYLLPYAAVTLTGSLGAGKTTLVSSLLRSYGITEHITSPTFTYLNVYTNDKGRTFYHFDLYRVASVDEFLQAGFDEYLYQPDSLTIIEWPEVIMPLLTHSVCHIDLEYEREQKKRILQIKHSPV